MKKTIFPVFIAIFLNPNLSAQHGSQKYVPETDSAVLEKLEEWKDLKFGLLMHWGAYSQWCIVESWVIKIEKV